jgi:hypothetical protein
MRDILLCALAPSSVQLFARGIARLAALHGRKIEKIFSPAGPAVAALASHLAVLSARAKAHHRQLV